MSKLNAREKSGAALLAQKPVSKQEKKYCGWTVLANESHILKSTCDKEVPCHDSDEEPCSVCLYNRKLDLPHLPDMVFPDNTLSIKHDASGCGIEFTALQALSRVDSGKRNIKIACADEWKASRSDHTHVEQEGKPFDWTFSTDYSGTLTGGLTAEPTDLRIDLEKLKRREQIVFYFDVTLFEDELHDNGTAVCSVKIRVMPSGFYILLRYFLRVDNVLVRINDARVYHEFGSAHILREFTNRESKIEDLMIPTALLVDPNEVITRLPIKSSKYEILKLPFPSEVDTTTAPPKPSAVSSTDV